MSAALEFTTASRKPARSFLLARLDNLLTRIQRWTSRARSRRRQELKALKQALLLVLVSYFCVFNASVEALRAVGSSSSVFGDLLWLLRQPDCEI